MTCSGLLNGGMKEFMVHLQYKFPCMEIYSTLIHPHITLYSAKMDENSTTSDCNSAFTQKQKNNLLIAKSVTGMLSLAMCLIAVFLVFCLRLHKYFTYRLAMYQILSSLCLSVVQVLGLTLLNYDENVYQQIACKTTAFFLEYFLGIKLIFTTCLVFHLFCLAVCLKNFQKFEIGYVLSSILFPLLYSWIPFINESYGVSGAWCSIKSWEDDCATQKYLEGIIEQFVLWYGPIFVSLTLSVVAVFIILIVLAQRAYAHKNPENECLIENHEHNQNKKAIKELLPLLAYPVIFYVVALFPLINRIDSAISPNATFGWFLGHALCQASWGFFSSWALIIHILVMRQLKKKKYVQIKKHLSCRKANSENSFIVLTTYTEGSTKARPAKSDIDNV